MRRILVCLVLLCCFRPGTAQLRENAWQDGRDALLAKVASGTAAPPVQLAAEQVPGLLRLLAQVSAQPQLAQKVKGGTASAAEVQQLDGWAQAAGQPSYAASLPQLQSLVWSYLALREENQSRDLLLEMDRVSACMDTLFVCARSDEEWKSTLVHSMTIKQAEFPVRVFATLAQKHRVNLPALRAHQAAVMEQMEASADVRKMAGVFDTAATMQQEVCAEAAARAATCRDRK